MSGLEKWNRRESALCRLKDFLLRERPAARESLNSSNGSEDSIELDLDQSFQQIIKAHMNKRNKSLEDKENLYKTACENTLHTSVNHKLEQKEASNETMYSLNDTTIVKDILSDSDNDSFEELERMCNKTFSDPDNTIHQYLAKRSQGRCNSSIGNANNESACLSRLLKDIDEQLEEGRAEYGEQTQLNDIEAPSYLWDNTIGGDLTGLLMTPDPKIKFQPKTPAITEETISDSISNPETFKSDLELSSVDQYLSTNETSSLAKRADETFISLNTEKQSRDTTALLENSVIDALSESLIDLDCTSEVQNKLNGTIEAVSENDKIPVDDVDFSHKTIPVENCNESIELIYLDDNDENNEITIAQENETNPSLSDTFYVTPKRNIPKRVSVVTQNLIDLEAPTLFKDMKPEIKLEPVRPKIITDINGDSIILLSDEDDSYNDDNDSESHNTAFSIDLEESTNLDLSRMHDIDTKGEFNDTLEEIDYIMKQGMKYLADTKQLPPCLKKCKEQMHSPSPMSSPQTPTTVVKKTKKYLAHEKPKSVDQFKKPQSFTKIPQCKFLAATKKPAHFQHIVSPVGAYIKNTPKIPITTEFKPTLNVFNSKAVRGLDYSMKENSSKKNEQLAKEHYPGLPKKAYISSDVKQVVDQRKQITIPGGEKIHRFLHPSKVPAVIRHEGKIKSNMHSQQRPPLVNKADNSLADLSTISGDISLHILRDAKR